LRIKFRLGGTNSAKKLRISFIFSGHDKFYTAQGIKLRVKGGGHRLQDILSTCELQATSLNLDRYKTKF